MNAEEIMLAIVRALNQAAIPCMLVGSFASNYYGIVRSTQDADFVLQIEDLPVAHLRQILGPQFHLDAQAAFETITLGTHYVINHPASDFTVDLFLLRNDPYDQLSFRRRVLVPYGAGAAFVPSPEDVVITKLCWSKSGRRNKDIDDARAVLAVQQGKLDLAYMRKWCAQHGTLELLENLLKIIPPLPPA